MFYCETGKHLTRPGQRCVKVVSERRDKEYREQLYDKETGKESGIRNGKGWEIVRETNACDEHAKV